MESKYELAQKAAMESAKGDAGISFAAKSIIASSNFISGYETAINQILELLELNKGDAISIEGKAYIVESIQDNIITYKTNSGDKIRASVFLLANN